MIHLDSVNMTQTCR